MKVSVPPLRLTDPLDALPPAKFNVVLIAVLVIAVTRPLAFTVITGIYV